MRSVIGRAGLLAAALLLLLALSGCNNDETDPPPPPGGETIGLTFANPRVIEVHSGRHWALLLHDVESTPALQLVDLEGRRLLASLILDYYDVYDVLFLPGNQACFAGRPQGNIGYAVQFFSLPDLTLGPRIITATSLAGEHGYLAADTVGGWLYYSHAGGGDGDGIYRISLATKRLTDADNDGNPPYAFDNHLVSGLFDRPGHVAFDESERMLVVSNLDADYVTFLSPLLWGTLTRGAGHTFPIAGAQHLSTVDSVPNVRAQTLCGADGIYVFAGTSGTTAYLSRFGLESNGLDFVRAMPPSRSWPTRRSAICLHPRADVFSAFIVQRDTARQAIGQYRLNNLLPVDGAPLRTRAIADSAIAAIGVDVQSDKLVVADAAWPRLELVSIP